MRNFWKRVLAATAFVGTGIMTGGGSMFWVGTAGIGLNSASHQRNKHKLKKYHAQKNAEIKANIEQQRQVNLLALDDYFLQLNQAIEAELKNLSTMQATEREILICDKNILLNYLFDLKAVFRACITGENIELIAEFKQNVSAIANAEIKNFLLNLFLEQQPLSLAIIFNQLAVLYSLIENYSGLLDPDFKPDLLGYYSSTDYLINNPKLMVQLDNPIELIMQLRRDFNKLKNQNIYSDYIIKQTFELFYFDQYSDLVPWLENITYGMQDLADFDPKLFYQIKLDLSTEQIINLIKYLLPKFNSIDVIDTLLISQKNSKFIVKSDILELTNCGYGCRYNCSCNTFKSDYLKYLLKLKQYNLPFGAPSKLFDQAGETIGNIAIKNQDDFLIKILIKIYNYDFYKTDINGENVLHLLAKNQDLYLRYYRRFFKKIDYSLTNNKNLSIYDLAILYNNQPLINRFKRKFKTKNLNLNILENIEPELATNIELLYELNIIDFKLYNHNKLKQDYYNFLNLGVLYKTNLRELNGISILINRNVIINYQYASLYDKNRDNLIVTDYDYSQDLLNFILAELKLDNYNKYRAELALIMMTAFACMTELEQVELKQDLLPAIACQTDYQVLEFWEQEILKLEDNLDILFIDNHEVIEETLEELVTRYAQKFASLEQQLIKLEQEYEHQTTKINQAFNQLLANKLSELQADYTKSRRKLRHNF